MNWPRNFHTGQPIAMFVSIETGRIGHIDGVPFGERLFRNGAPLAVGDHIHAGDMLSIGRKNTLLWRAYWAIADFRARRRRVRL